MELNSPPLQVLMSYTLSDMPEGKGYTIYATKEGYAEAICEDISIVTGVVTKDVDFT